MAWGVNAGDTYCILKLGSTTGPKCEPVFKDEKLQLELSVGTIQGPYFAVSRSASPLTVFAIRHAINDMMPAILEHACLREAEILEGSKSLVAKACKKLLEEIEC
jgi:hypothetical protein